MQVFIIKERWFRLGKTTKMVTGHWLLQKVKPTILVRDENRDTFEVCFKGG